jgi:hypothetical protein
LIHFVDNACGANVNICVEGSDKTLAFITVNLSEALFLKCYCFLQLRYFVVATGLRKGGEKIERSGGRQDHKLRYQ